MPNPLYQDKGGLSIFEATEPQDYIRMFEVPCGSCMVLTPLFLGSEMKVWHEMIKEHNIYPASWYHFTPHSRGVWMEYNGQPLARCMIYRLKRDQPWTTFGDIKCANNGAARVLWELMAEELDFIYDSNPVHTREPFNVPAYYHPRMKTMLCPLPHCDNQEKDFSVVYNQEHTRGAYNFIFYPDDQAPDNAFKIKLTYDHHGYLMQEEVEQRLPRHELPSRKRVA